METLFLMAPLVAVTVSVPDCGEGLATLRPISAVAVIEPLVTSISNKFPPATVGVPVTEPLDVFRLKPFGKVPELIEYVYGEAPPLGVQLAT
jgi:hypothetical protein